LYVFCETNPTKADRFFGVTGDYRKSLEILPFSDVICPNEEGKGRVYNFGISVGGLLSSLFTGANSINIHTCPRPEGARGNRIRGGMADYNDNCPSGNGDILHTYNTVYLMPLCRIIDFKGQTNKLSLSSGK
jgi:hypothetical protein